MPVIVTRDKYDVWLDPDVNDFNTIRDILKPYDANLMRRYPVSRKPNNSKIDDAEAASPVTLDIPTQGQAVLAFSQCERVGYSLDMTSFSIFGESCPIQLPVTTPSELT